MIAWLDPGRLFWPVPAHSVSVFYGIGRRKASARRRDVRINSAEVLRNRSLIILVGHTKRASEPQLPIDHIRPNDRGWSVLDRIARPRGCWRTCVQKAYWRSCAHGPRNAFVESV